MRMFHYTCAVVHSDYEPSTRMHCRVSVVVCVCVCVCVCVQFDFLRTVTNQPGTPTDCLRAAIAWFKRVFFCKPASLCRYIIQAAAVLVHRSAILLALAGTRAYMHSRDVALDHVVFLLWDLPLSLAQLYIGTCVFSLLDVDLNYVQLLAGRKIWSYVTSK